MQQVLRIDGRNHADYRNKSKLKWKPKWVIVVITCLKVEKTDGSQIDKTISIVPNTVIKLSVESNFMFVRKEFIAQKGTNRTKRSFSSTRYIEMSIVYEKT